MRDLRPIVLGQDQETTVNYSSKVQRRTMMQEQGTGNDLINNGGYTSARAAVWRFRLVRILSSGVVHESGRERQT
jgi:hypothetical protein